MPTPIGLAEHHTRIRRVLPRYARALKAWLGHDLTLDVGFNSQMTEGSIRIGGIVVTSSLLTRGRPRPIIEHHITVARPLLASTPESRAIERRSFIPSDTRVYVVVSSPGQAVSYLRRLIDPDKLAALLREQRGLVAA